MAKCKPLAWRGCEGAKLRQRIPDFFAYNLTELTDITIPNSVTNIGYDAFYGCSGIKHLTWNAINCNSKGNIPTSNIEQVTIGDAVQIIPDYFVSNSIITEVTIPNSVTNIGSYAFQNCGGLASIDIPNSVTNIGGYAFSGCSGLTSIIIPKLS